MASGEQKDDEKPEPGESFASLRSRFEAMASPAAPFSSSTAASLTTSGTNSVGAPRRGSASMKGSSTQLEQQQQEQNHRMIPSGQPPKHSQQDIAWGADDLAAWPPPFFLAKNAGHASPAPPVPRRPLTPSLSVPSLSHYPGAKEALAYADLPVGTPTPPPPPVPERPQANGGEKAAAATSGKDEDSKRAPSPSRLDQAPDAFNESSASSSSTLPSKPLTIPQNHQGNRLTESRISSTSSFEASPRMGTAIDKPLPSPSLNAHPHRSRAHTTTDAWRMLSNASHLLTHHGQPALKHSAQSNDSTSQQPPDRGSPFSTPSESGTPNGTPPSSHGFLPPPARRSGLVQPKAVHGSLSTPLKPSPQLTEEEVNEGSSDNEEGDIEVPLSPSGQGDSLPPRLYDELPDASRANRRPPRYTPPRSIQAKGHIACAAVCCDLVVTGHHDKLRTYRAGTGWEHTTHQISLGHERREIKICALAFRPDATVTDGNNKSVWRYLWCGTKEGDLFEYDTAERIVSSYRANAHTAPVILLERVDSHLISVDESGKICSWVSKKREDGSSTPLSLKEAPITQRISMDRFSRAMIFDQELWVASPGDAPGSRAPKIRVYRPFCDDKPFNAVSRPVVIPESLGGMSVGLVSCGAIVPLQPDYIYLGHQSGHVSIWSRTTYACMRVQPLGTAGVTAMSGVRGGHLWTGDRQGNIRIYDVRENPWMVVKAWKAHHGTPVSILITDPASMAQNKLQVLSAPLEGEMHLWDALLTSDWMIQELESRLVDYSSFRSLTSFHVTFNIDAATVADYGDRDLPGADLFEKAVREGNAPDFVFLGLQEMVDLGDTRVVAKSLLMGGARRSKAMDVGEKMSHQARAWTEKFSSDIRRRLDRIDGAPRYRIVLQDSLVGLYSAIFVREDELRNIKDAAIASIKTGFGGRMGNKGAIVASIRVDNTSLAWVNCHLAAGQRHVRERNADLVNVFDSMPFVDRAAKFQSTDMSTIDAYAGGGDGAMIMPDHEIVFLSGDLNYRIDLPRSQWIDVINQRKLANLLQRDQLHRQIRENPAFRLRPFHEAAITFAPTYKYDRNTDNYDTSEKRRAPAYCDRILWYSRSERAHAVECHDYIRDERPGPSDHRAVMGRFSFQIRKANSKQRQAILEDLQMAWTVTQAERLRAAREYYFPPPPL